jgi:hypothetical protein
MDELSLARDAARSTDSLLAGAHLCDQVAFLLGVEEATARRVFLGEPVEVVLAMAEWVLCHEGEEGFYSEGVLPQWAERRGRGAWRTQERRVEGCRHCRGFVEGVENPNPAGNSRQSECPVCRGAGIGLKPLRIVSSGKKD